MHVLEKGVVDSKYFHKREFTRPSLSLELKVPFLTG